jgi:salicylate hydroxylase
MLPTQGQGASQAIEDAEALGAFFEGISEAPSAEALSEILDVSFSFTLLRADTGNLTKFDQM